MKRLWKGIRSVVDFEDVLYFSGMCVVSVGGWLVYPPLGLVVAGLLLMLPALLSMFRAKGPTE